MLTKQSLALKGKAFLTRLRSGIPFIVPHSLPCKKKRRVTQTFKCRQISISVIWHVLCDTSEPVEKDR